MRLYLDPKEVRKSGEHQVKQLRAAQLVPQGGNKAYAASEPGHPPHEPLGAWMDSEPVHVPGELDHMEEERRLSLDCGSGPDTWTDAERNL